jgi:hypothetical protein
VTQLILVAMLVAFSSAACTKARANTEIVMPELLPPPPPPRIVESFVIEPLPTVGPSPAESALAAPPARRPPQATTKPEAPKVEEPSILPEPTRADAPALTIKPGPSVQAQTEASIRALLERAQRDLQRVNYAALNADGRVQFDTARGFMQQAQEALKTNNLPFAGKLADKAATMAAILVR